MPIVTDTTSRFTRAILLFSLCLSPNVQGRDRDPVRVEVVAAAMMGTPLVHVKLKNVTSNELRNVELRLKVPLKSGKYVPLKPSHLTSHSPGATVTYGEDSLVARFPALKPDATAEVIVSFSEYRVDQILRPGSKDVMVKGNGG